MPAASFGFIGRRSGPLPLMFSELQAKHFGFGSRDLRTDPCVCVKLEGKPTNHWFYSCIAGHRIGLSKMFDNLYSF